MEANYLTILYWFCHTSTWIHHRCTRVPHPEPPLQPPSPYHPSGSSQCTCPEHPVSCIKPGLLIRFLYDIIHVSMPFSQIIPPSPLPQSPKDCFIHLCLFCCLALIQFLADGWGSVVMALMDNSFKELMWGCWVSQDYCSQCPWPCGRPLWIHTSTSGSQAHTDKSGSIFCGVSAPFTWVLLHTRVCLCLQESVYPVLWKFYNQILLTFKVWFPGDSQSLCWIPRLGSRFWGLELLQQSENFFGILFSSLWIACPETL